MSEREITSDEDPKKASSEEPRAVFVDTNLNTHLVVPIFSTSTVTSLKRQLRREHFECFPELGRIEINALSVRFNDNYYHLPDYMLLKTAFHGVVEGWFVFADVWIKSQKNIDFKHIEPRPQYHIEFNCVKPCPQHHNEFKHLEPPHQAHVTPDLSCEKKKKKKNKKKKKQNKQKKGTKDVEKDVETKSNVKEQFSEKARDCGQWAVPKNDNVSVTKHLDEKSEAHHDTSIVHTSVLLLKDGGDNNVKDSEEGAVLVHQLEGSTNFTQTLNKESGIDNFQPPPQSQKKKNRKTKKNNINGVDQSPAATVVLGSDILEKGDAPSDNKNTICQKGLKYAGEASPSQLNNVPEKLFQHDTLNLEKENEEDVPLLKSDNIAKKKRTKGSGQESRTAEMVAPLLLNNVPELLLPEEESLNLVDGAKEIKEDVAPVKSENTAKKRKTNKAKSSGTENQELSGHISRPEECVESMSEIPKKRSRNRKSVPEKDPPKSPVKEKPDREIQEIAAPITVIQSDKPKKRSQKKQPVPAVNTSSLSVNQHSGETMMETNAPNKADDILTKCDTDDALLKPDNAAKRRKTNESERKCKTAESVTQLHLNNVPELLSQDESLNLVEREQEIEKDVDLLKSEHPATKRKVRESKRSDIENHDLSSTRQNDLIADKSKRIREELPLPDDIGKPEKSVETMDRSIKERSQKRKAVSGRVHPGLPLKEQPDEETRERVVPAVDPSSLSVVRNLDVTVEEMDARKKADDLLTNCDTDDALLKSDNAAKKRKMNETERKRTTAGKVTQSYLNNVPELLSQDESLNLVEREKKIEEEDSPLKSEYHVKKRKLRKSNESGTENHDLSSKRQNDDIVEDNSRHVCGELSSPGDVDKTEESMETMSGSLKKRPQNRKAVLGTVPPGSPLKEQPDEESVERAVPKTSIQSDKPKKRSQKKQPVTVKDTSSLTRNQQLDEEALETDAPKSVVKPDDLSTRDTEDAKNQMVIQGEGNHNDLSEIPSPEVSSVLSDLRHLEKSGVGKQKAKKLDQYSAVDTLSNGHNFVESKRNRGSAKTSVQGHNKSMPPLIDTLVPLADPIRTNRKHGVSHASVDDGSRISGNKIMMEMDGPKTVEQADDLSTDAESNDTQHQKEVRQSEEHHGEFSQAPYLDISVGLTEAQQLEKPQASKQKAKKSDLPSSIDTTSNGHNLLGSKKKRGIAKKFEHQKCIIDQKHDRAISLINANHSTISKEMKDTPVTLADPSNALRKTGVSHASVDDGSKPSEALSISVGSTVRKIRKEGKAKELPKVDENRVGLRKSSRLIAKETKKGLLASSRAIFEDGTTSSSSDDDDRTDALGSSTTLPPDNLSSSDYSEGESQGVVISQPDSSNNNGSKANSSGLKLGSILRSSSSYKKAKLVASQSQNDSPPPEFVPDSLPDM